MLLSVQSIWYILTYWPHRKFEWNFIYYIFQIISVINGWGIPCELALRWTSLDLTDDKSTLVQVMAWCRQATSYYLSKWWPRSLPPYGITRPQWVKLTICLISGYSWTQQMASVEFSKHFITIARNQSQCHIYIPISDIWFTASGVQPRSINMSESFVITIIISMQQTPT